MNEKALNDLQGKADLIRAKIWDDGLVRTTGPGDSESTGELPFHHSLEETALYFALGKFTGTLDTNTGTNILVALEGQQVTDESSEFYGAFPRYSEDGAPENGRYVFAVTAPLLTAKLAVPGALRVGEAAIVDRILERASRWLGQ